ncbi:MAG TPA: hypothetical protein VG722_05390, partial [Tepidisphaeraceae bacterium]|nr:hypothetical protein [Tepidisphaeraceae bacterium]
YLSGMSWHWAYVCSALSAVALAVSIPDLRRMSANHAVRRALCALALLAIWMLLLLALVRNYSGGMWSGDWVEHFDRTQFFLHRENTGHLFIGLYQLPARPPMMNLLAAFFLAQVGKGFPAFELCFGILNLIAFLPAMLLMNRLAPRGMRGFWFFIIALISSPFFAENVTYTWTKLFCAFYVLLGIALYLRRRPVLAFVMLAAGCLVHYSAGTFTLFLAGHYLWNFFRNRPRWRQLLAIIVLSLGLLGTWFGWSIQRYGVRATFAANTSVTDTSKFTPAQNSLKILKNIYDTVVPPIFRIDPRWHNQSALGFLRDAAFFYYQQNILFMIGSVGAVVAVSILFRVALQRRTPEKRFWFGLLAFCIPVAIATVGEYEPLGLAHAVLQPIALIGIAMVAAWIPRLPRWILIFLTTGWAFDFALGVWLQFYLENFSFTSISGPGGTHFWSMPVKLLAIAAENFGEKQTFHLKFIGDYCSSASTALLIVLAIVEAISLLLLWPLATYCSSRGSRRASDRKFS